MEEAPRGACYRAAVPAPDAPDVVLLRLLADAAHAHVLDHALVQRAHGQMRLSVIIGVLLGLKFAEPSILADNPLDRHAIVTEPDASP